MDIDVDRRQAIYQCMMRDCAAVDLIKLKVTAEELGSCGIPNVESAAQAFLAFDRTRDLGRLELALNTIWMSKDAPDDDALYSASERASLAMALTRPDSVRIIQTLNLHTDNDMDGCLLVANKYATGARAPETIALYYGTEANSGDWPLFGSVLQAVLMDEFDMVIDLARSGWDVAKALHESCSTELGPILGHRDFPQGQRDAFLDLLLRRSFSADHLIMAIECGAHLPASCDAYVRVISHSRGQSPEWLAIVSGLITSFPNWREAWPRDGDSPLHQVIEGERARAEPSRLARRPRCGP